MISRTIIIALAGILTIGLNDCLSQDLQPGQVLQNLEEEQKLTRLQVNINAMTIALIKYAKENGSSVSEAGLWTGKFFAQSWGENLTPEGFVRGMNNNWQMFDSKTEIIEATSDRIQGKRDMLMSKKEFEEIFGNYGVTQSEFQMFFEGVQKGITESFGLSFSEEIDGDSILFTVSAGNN